MRTQRNVAARLGGWSAGHPWRAVVMWILLVLAAAVAGGAAGTVTLSEAQLGSGESGRASRAVERAFDLHASESILVESDRLTVDDPAFAAAVRDVVRRVESTGLAADLRSPLDPAHARQISADRRAALVQLDLAGELDDSAARVGPLVEAVEAAADAHPQVRIGQFGEASLGRSLEETIAADLEAAERLSLPITLGVLLFTFGALVAALLPMALALTAILGAGGLLALSSHLVGANDTSSSVLLLIGLAVGVDYALFYVKREREERAAGRSASAALRAAAATSGRSVLLSGLTVLVALAGMLLSGSPVFYGIAIAAMLVVLVAVVGSLTVLPALMSLLGDRIERGRLPYLSRLRHAERDSRIWGFVLDRSLAHPVAAVVVAGGMLTGLSVPALDMRTATPGASDLPQDLPVMQTFARIGQHFPGGPTPAVVVIEAEDVSAPDVMAGITELRRQALATGKVNEPVRVQLSEDRSVAMVSLPLVGDGEDATSQDALRVLREQVLPSTVGAVDGTTVGVTGMTAGTVDFNDLMSQRAPLVFVFVLGLSFLLLVLFFRSVIVAAKAIALNLLSVSAAYGVLVLVFQHGWGEQLLGFQSTGSIAAWLPLFLFVVLFGLSMDYHVFILSRVKEGVDRGLSTADAVSAGIRTTAGTVTSAATVMVFVFLTFATLSQVSMKQLGVGLATAVLLDATVVRGVLLPASMRLLGEWNWYLPRWLSWLPEVRHEVAAPVEVPTPRTESAVTVVARV